MQTHLGHAKTQTRRQQREQQLYPRAHLAAQPRASSTDRAFMEAQSPSLLSTARGGTAARPAELRARRRSVPTVVSPAEISEEEEEESARARLGTQLSSPPCKTKKKKAPSCWINDHDNLQVLNVFPQRDVQSSLFISPLSAQVCVFSKRLIY